MEAPYYKSMEDPTRLELGSPHGADDPNTLLVESGNPQSDNELFNMGEDNTAVDTGEQKVVLNWGKYVGTLKTPGCFFVNPCGAEVIAKSSTRDQLHLTSNTVADLNGNPLVVSGVVNFQIYDTRRAALDVIDSTQFIRSQATCVLKLIASSYPYESTDGSPSLKSESSFVREQLKRSLQEKVRVAGARIDSFELTDLSYAPEIAQAMLARQQAEATVSARDVIVKGAIAIASDAVAGLEVSGVQLSREEKAALTGNLLVTLCGDSKRRRDNNPNSNVASRPVRENHNAAQLAEAEIAKLLQKQGSFTSSD